MKEYQVWEVCFCFFLCHMHCSKNLLTNDNCSNNVGNFVKKDWSLHGGLHHWFKAWIIIDGGYVYVTKELQVHFLMLFHNVTCYTNFALSHIHVNITKLNNSTCILVATCVILCSLKCSKLAYMNLTSSGAIYVWQVWLHSH